MIFSGEIPQYVDGVESKAVCELAAHPNAVTIPFEKQALAEAARKTSSFYPVVEGEGAESVFVQMRYDADRKLLYAALLNHGPENRAPLCAFRCGILPARFPSGKRLCSRSNGIWLPANDSAKSFLLKTESLR